MAKRFLFSATLLTASLLAGSTVQAETLQEALASAYRNNPQLMAERARVREIDENYVQAHAQGRFTANAQASAGITTTKFRTFTAGSFFSPAERVLTKDTFVPRSFAITGQKPLYQGGRVRSLKGQAKYGILAARENLRNTEQSVLLSAATAYADVLQDEAIAGIRRNNVRVLTRQGDAARDRFDVGAGTRTDIAQADSRLAASEIGLATADANLAESRATYYRIMGHMPEQLERLPDFGVPPTVEAAIEMALTYNPQLEASRYAQDAAKFGIDVAKSVGRPTISLQTFTQISTDQGGAVLGQESIGLTANLSIPLMTGGLQASRVRAAKAAETRTIFETRNVEDAVQERVTSIWVQLEGSKRALAASQRQIDAANVAYEGVEIEQQVGTRSALDVLNAEQEVLNARLAFTQSQRNVDILEFQLLVLVGAFDALSLQVPVEIYNPADNFNEVSTLSPFDPLRQMVEDIPLSTPETIKQMGRDLKYIPQTLDPILPGDQSPKPEVIKAPEPEIVETLPVKRDYRRPEYNPPQDVTPIRPAPIEIKQKSDGVLSQMKEDFREIPLLGRLAGEAPKPKNVPQ